MSTSSATPAFLYNSGPFPAFPGKLRSGVGELGVFFVIVGSSFDLACFPASPARCKKAYLPAALGSSWSLLDRGGSVGRLFPDKVRRKWGMDSGVICR